MTSNKTTVTIAELCEKHWPEGCKYFYRTDGRYWFRLDNTPVLLYSGAMCEPDARQMAKTMAAAAVAAQHFRNKAEKMPHGPNCTAELFRAAIEVMHKAKAWEELCRDL